MTFDARTPDVRALASAAAVGGLAGLFVGSAYLAGGLAHSAVFRSASLQPRSATGPRAGLAPSSTPGLTGGLRNPLRLASLATSTPPSIQHSFGSATGPGAECLAKAVYYEARGESASGQAAVAQVVLNRVSQPAFPKTICGVVFQRAGVGCQFSFACNGAMHDALDRDAWRRAMTVARRAVGGAVMSEVGDATEFQAARSGPWAAGLLKVAQVGAHAFYRVVRRGGGAWPVHGRFAVPSAITHGEQATAPDDPRRSGEGPAPSFQTASAQPADGGAPAVAQGGGATPSASGSTEKLLAVATDQP